MYATLPDSIAYIPKRDVWFYGFGIFSNYNKRDMQLKVKWAIGSARHDWGEFESEWFDYEALDAEKDEETKLFTVDIRNFGEKPIRVAEGQWIHCQVKHTTEDYDLRRTGYGQEGT